MSEEFREHQQAVEQTQQHHHVQRHPQPPEKADWWFLLGPRYAARLIQPHKLPLRKLRAGRGATPWPPHNNAAYNTSGNNIEGKKCETVGSDLRSGWGEPYDQGEICSCTANALAGVIRYLAAKWGVKIDPSRMYLFVKERLMANPGKPLKDTGSDVAFGVTWATDQGVCPELLCPYILARVNDIPPPVCDVAAANCKISGAYDLMANTKSSADVLANIQSALSKGFPVLMAFEVYSSFMSETVAKSGSVPMPNVKTEKLEGGHEVAIVGYIPQTDQYIIANSWGPSWASKGFCFFPAAFIANSKLCFELLAFTQVIVPPTPPAPKPAPAVTNDPAAALAKALEAVKLAQATVNAAVSAATQAANAANIASNAANAASIAANAAALAANSAVAAAKKASIAANAAFNTTKALSPIPINKSC
jgi:hypothetical protein